MLLPCLHLPLLLFPTLSLRGLALVTDLGLLVCCINNRNHSCRFIREFLSGTQGHCSPTMSACTITRLVGLRMNKQIQILFMGGVIRETVDQATIRTISHHNNPRYQSLFSVCMKPRAILHAWPLRHCLSPSVSLLLLPFAIHISFASLDPSVSLSFSLQLHTFSPSTCIYIYICESGIHTS